MRLIFVFVILFMCTVTIFPMISLLLEYIENKDDSVLQTLLGLL